MKAIRTNSSTRDDGWSEFDGAHAPPRTIRHLVARYYGAPRYLRLRPATRQTYRGILDRFCEAHGRRDPVGLTRARVDQIIGGMADRPGAALVFLKRFRTVARFAVDMGWLAADPTHGVRAFGSGEFHTWTEDEIGRFEAHWPIGSKQRLAFALHLYTGQRRSDVHRMAWSDYPGGVIHVVQQKTGTRLAVAVHPDLAAIMAGAPRKGATILLTEWGRPFTVAGYGMWMSRAIRAAGLPARCVAHGLRKAAARRLAEAGCSTLEIMAMTGHKSLSEVERYTRAADQERLARQAIERLWASRPK